MISIGVAVGVCEAFWRKTPNALSLRTSVIGYPIFAGFDYVRYFTAFDLVAVLFPVLGYATFDVLGRFGPLRRRPPTLPLRPVLTTSAVAAAPARGRANCVVSVVARLVLPAVVLAVEVSARAPHNGRVTVSGVATGIGYVAAVAASALLVASHRAGGRRNRTAAVWLGAFNSVNVFAALLVIPGLLLVSAGTTVEISHPAHLVHYPWLPLWFALLATAIGLVTTFRRYRRSDREGDRRRLEAAVLAVVVGTIFVFIEVSTLPGALGPFQAFDDAQDLAGAQLIFVHGLLPWRDISLLHGLIEDAFDGIIGMAIFSHSRWGASAGQSVLLTPIAYCIEYLFAVYFSRRNPIVPILVAAILIVNALPQVPRFAYLPLLLVAFDWMLRRPSKLRTAVFAELLVVEALLVPEVGLLAIGLLATLVAFEWLSREPRSSLRTGFDRTLTCVVVGALSLVGFAVYLVATRSVSGFIDYYEINSPDHALWGAHAINWSIQTLSTKILFVGPVALYLIALAAAAVKLRRRGRWTSTQVTLVAAGSFVLLYFQKALDRLDVAHIHEVAVVCTPFVILCGVVVVEAFDGVSTALLVFVTSHLPSLDRAVAARSASDRQPQLERRYGTFAALVAAIAVGVGSVGGLTSLPGRDHAVAPVASQLPLLGYTVPGTVDVGEVNALGRVLDAYAGTTGPVFDFSNEPGVTYFLLNRVPGSSFFHVEAAETPAAQRLVIAQLTASRPRLVVWANETFGLSIPSIGLYDGIPGEVRNYLVSEWLLKHYRPFADVQGQLLLIRDDLHPVRSPTSLGIPGVTTTNLYFAGQSCAFGDIPDYFVSPTPLTRRTTPVTLSKPTVTNTSVEGFASTSVEGLDPAPAVYAAIGSRVIAVVHPGFSKAELLVKYGTTRVANSDFSSTFELPRGAEAALYALDRNGNVSKLELAGTVPAWYASAQPTEIRTPDGAVRRVTTRPDRFGLIYVAQRLDERLYTLSLGVGQRFGTGEWLDVRARPAIGSATFTVRPPGGFGGSLITFAALPRSGSTLTVGVGACLAWDGYGRTLDLVENGGAPISSLWLAR